MPTIFLSLRGDGAPRVLENFRRALGEEATTLVVVPTNDESGYHGSAEVTDVAAAREAFALARKPYPTLKAFLGGGDGGDRPLSIAPSESRPRGGERPTGEGRFALPTDFDDWLYLTQLIQARAMTVACEWFRTRSQCRGALYWQLNDCWPVSSWAAIDGDGKPKPLYYATKRFFRERLLSIQPDGNGLALWAHNDSDEWWDDHASVDFRPFDDPEKIEYGWEENFRVAPRSLQRIVHLKDLELTSNSTHYLSVMSHRADSTFWFFDADKNLNYPEPKWTTEVDGSTLRVTAQTLLRDFTINADRFGGVAAVNGVTLLPGETWEVEITGADLSQVDFGGRPIVQCANWYGTK